MKKYLVCLLLVLALSLLLTGAALAHESDCPCAQNASEPEAKEYSSGTVNLALTEKLSLSGNIEITGGTVNLCLDGNTLDMQNYKIVVADGSTLNISDCTGSGGILGTDSGAVIEVKSGGKLVIEYAVVEARVSSQIATNCAVSVEAGGSFTMEDGWLTSESATTVTAVGECIIQGGRIANKNTDSVKIGACIGTDTNTEKVTISGGSFEGARGVSMADGTLTVSGKPYFSDCDVGIHFASTDARLSFGSYTSSDKIKVSFAKTEFAFGNIPAGSVIVEGLADEATAIAQAKFVTPVDSNASELTPVKNGDKWDLQLLDHECSYTYSASGAVITENCSIVDNPCGHAGTYTITAPTGDLVYDGGANDVTGVTDAWGAQTLPTLSYQKDGATVTETVDAGAYEATATIGGESVSVRYTVRPAVTLNTDALKGAAVTQVSVEGGIKLTIKPDAGTECYTPFRVSCTGTAQAGTETLETDGSRSYVIRSIGNETTITVSGNTRFVKPDPALVAADYINETVSFPAGYELNTNDAFDGTAVSSGGSISAWLESDSGELRFRRAAAEGIAAGDAVQIIFTKRDSLSKGEGYTVDFKTGTVTALEGYELSGDEGVTWGAGLSDMGPSDWFRVRKTATATAPQSYHFSNSLPGTPSAPILTAKAESVVGQNDGEISGFEADVNYEMEGEDGWESVAPTDGKLTGLAPRDILLPSGGHGRGLCKCVGRAARA